VVTGSRYQIQRFSVTGGVYWNGKKIRVIRQKGGKKSKNATTDQKKKEKQLSKPHRG